MILDLLAATTLLSIPLLLLADLTEDDWGRTAARDVSVAASPGAAPDATPAVSTTVLPFEPLPLQSAA
jgi:hypothetical protein